MMKERSNLFFTMVTSYRLQVAGYDLNTSEILTCDL